MEGPLVTGLDPAGATFRGTLVLTAVLTNSSHRALNAVFES
jgi:hypothetical protein